MIKRNPSQERAVTHLSGPMMVLAGPGSGKTSVIVDRTEYLIQEAKILSSSILVVTFSKAAAREMRERFRQQTRDRYPGVTFGTFHGVFYGILKHTYHLSAENILSEEQKTRFLRELTETYGEEMLREGDFLEDLSREISTVKANRIPPEHYYSGCCPDEVFRCIYRGYVDLCRRNRLLDFDDMLTCCYDLLKEREDVRRAWQQKFQYILVDEFQDINQLQYDTIRLLSQPENNLFVVGDDDQSIYHFRGARPEIMLNFTKDFPSAQRVLLDVNYRCSGEILQSALSLINHNEKRYRKKLKTPNGDGESVKILELGDLREEYLFVVRELLDYREKGGLLENTAILFRTNLEAEGLIRLCMEYQLPFSMKERLPNLFEHWIARDLLAYLQMSRGKLDRGLFLQVMNRPNRYFSREAVRGKQVDFEELRSHYAKMEWMVDRIDLLEHYLKVLSKMNPYAGINFIRKGIGYEEYLRDYASFRKVKPEELLEILDRLQESARDHRTLESWLDAIAQYSRQLKEQARKQETTPEGVTISTLHSAKGLEYERVYILNVNEGTIPYRKAMLAAQLEEERRLFYVGMTRARKELILCSVRRQFDREKERSRFLTELPGGKDTDGKRNGLLH